MTLHVALTHRTRLPLRPALRPRAARRCACARRRIAARRSSPTRCRSRPRRISSTGSRTRSATSWRASWCPGRDAANSRPPSTSSPTWRPSTPSTSSSRTAPPTGPSPTTPPLAAELAPYLAPPAAEPLLDAYLAGLDAQAERRPSTSSCDLNRRLSGDIAYRIAHGARRADAARDAGAWRSGSCRDSGWLLVQILRRLGLAARFVSGYLIQLRPT